MADAAVEFLLGNLKQLLVYNVDLISGVKDQVGSLCNDLRTLAAFVKDATEKQTESAIVNDLLREIRIFVYEAEDVIETYVVHTAVHKARKSIEKAFHILDYPATLRSIAKKIEALGKKVQKIYEKKAYGFQSLQIEESSRRNRSKRRPPVVEQDNVVGLDNEAKEIIERLNGGSEELEVISVVGMGGLGKTTLAKKVFNDPSIQFNFLIRGWSYVSQVYSRREIFLGILNHVTLVSKDMYQMNDDMLAECLHKHLQEGRYLIVMDDVWTKEAWEELKVAFPKNSNGSRILLTSRHREVALHANPVNGPYQLRFLTDDESWELLQTKVFRQVGNCPSDLEELGKQISKKCRGLPLAIVVIAGILLKKEKTCNCWERVAASVSTYIAMNPEECMNILALSYNHLPYHLKACFIYLGIFPEDFEIPVWKLIHLWVAEGFIEPVGNVSLEDMAEENLEELVDRNLVLVDRRRSNGGIKSCRVHDMLHDLCVKQAEAENFFKEIRFQFPSPSIHASGSIFRRCCVHSRVLEYISAIPPSPHIRSFLCFALEESQLPPKHISSIPDAFKLLRVLDIRPINFSRFPIEIIQLVLLRYIALLGNFKVLPAIISNLWNLQTLIVKTISRDFKIEADIWKMVHLRHIYLSGSSDLPSPPSKARKGNQNPLVRGNLQTISTVSPDICAENILARIPNLKKLGIRGNLVKLVEEKAGSSKFDNLAKLDNLETLKLWNDTYPDPPLKGKLPYLPRWYKFPPKMKKLTLSHTLLDWEHMSILAMLPKLEVLKLKENAFTGNRWEQLEGCFSQLRVLEIGKTNLVYWEASSHHFPRLQRIILKHCDMLDAIPSGLGDVPDFQIIELYWSSSAAAASAKKIHQQQLEKQHQQSMENKVLKLVIHPPDA